MSAGSYHRKSIVYNAYEFMHNYEVAAGNRPILELVDARAVSSQEQLRGLLKERGIEATQATLSRDIRDLGLVKRSARRGLQAT